MKILHSLTLATLALLATTLPGKADIVIRVSVKFFTDANGNPPAVDLDRGPTPDGDTMQAIAQWLL